MPRGRLLELARSSQDPSQGGTAGYDGVYKSGAGFGAELRKGTKRLRQTGFRSAFEAALERARWAKPGPSPQEVDGLQDDAPQRPRAEGAQLSVAPTSLATATVAPSTLTSTVAAAPIATTTRVSAAAIATTAAFAPSLSTGFWTFLCSLSSIRTPLHGRS